MGGGGKDDAGLLGWKDWQFPDDFFNLKKYITPDPIRDGRYDPLDGREDRIPGYRIRDYENFFNPVRYPNLDPHWSYHLSNFTEPLMRNAASDLSGLVYSGADHRCGEFELQAMECMEYYGVKQGMSLCKDWYDDLMECRHQTKRRLRNKFMHVQRDKINWLEYMQGKRDKYYEPPPKFNAYFSPMRDPRYDVRYGPGTN